MNVDEEADPFGVAPLSTRICPKCIRGDMVHGSLVDPCPDDIRGQISWCSKAVCKECRFEWYVCRLCPNIRQILDTKRKFLGHGYKFHGQSHTSTKTSRTTSVANNVPKKRKANIVSKKTSTNFNPQTNSPVS
jgi:hypothetical protein